MSAVNQVLILGHVGKDPETRYTSSGIAISKFTVAVNEHYKDKGGQKQKRTEWFGITCFGKLGEVVNKYVKKGMQVFVQGHLRHEEWEKDGAKHRKLEIHADEVSFLSSVDKPDNKPIVDPEDY